jgi:hypothetical protein
MGSTQPHTYYVPGVLFPGVKRLGRGADPSRPSGAEVKLCEAVYLLRHTLSWLGY